MGSFELDVGVIRTMKNLGMWSLSYLWYLQRTRLLDDRHRHAAWDGVYEYPLRPTNEPRTSPVGRWSSSALL